MPEDSAIRLWLLGLPDRQRSSKRPREPDMATPPPSALQTRRSQSPSKKRKIDQNRDDPDDGGSQDAGATPRSGPPSQRSALAALPALPARPASFRPPSSTGLGHSSAPSLASDRQSSRRSASPVKTITRLQRLDKPVLYRSLDGRKARFRQLPEDARQLYHDVLAITTYQAGIYPAEIRPQIESLFEDFKPPDSIYRKPEEQTRALCRDDKGRLAQDARKEEGREEEQEGREEEGREEEEEGPFFDYLPLSSLFADRPEASLPQTRFALAEFYKVRAIERIAKECLDLRRSKAA